ncbi:hypothetical protein HD806DRAFT_540310 [Xylariaceae sp. AK1471]|nr:hypothetical protein HD806DRAFT_540310 [Xylariaceae sp. AK1471]
MKYILASLASLAALCGVQGHAVMQTPVPRGTGPKQVERCGALVTAVLEKDHAGPIENAVGSANADYKCNAYLCRGYQYEDNVNNVHAVKAGDVLTFHIDLVAGHHPGYANVSVVDLASNKVIGSPLLYWANWPDSTSGPPRNDTDFKVTIPSTLGTACNTGGKCAIQWYWWASGNKQTYESCVDFYLRTMALFHRFPDLPPELRIEIWREHFAACHGTQIHVFLSSSPDADVTQSQGPKYVNLDATTNLPGYDTLGAAGVSAEAWAVFKESFHVGDTGCLSPQNALLDSSGRLIDYDPSDDQSDLPGGSMRGLYALAAQEELRRQSIRFAIDCERDMVYIVDQKVQPLFRALCSTSWMQNVKRVAFQILNFQSGGYTSRLEQWAQWDDLLGNPPPGVQSFLSNQALEDVLLVSVPNEQDYTSLKPNIYGFVVVDPDSTMDEAIIMSNRFRSISLRMYQAYPPLLRKIGCGVDAIPSRARFSISPFTR